MLKPKSMKLYIAAQAICVMTLAASPLSITTNAASVVSAKEILFAQTKLPTVAISKNSSFQVKQINIMPGDEGKNVYFTVTINNGDTKSLKLIDYWIQLQTTSGTKYTTKIVQQDKTKKEVLPKSTAEISFYATVNSNVEISNLMVKFVKWDFSAANYERVLGITKFPTTYATKAPLNTKRLINVNNLPVKSKVISQVVNILDTEKTSDVSLELENMANKELDLTQLKYYISTFSGTLFPLDLAKDEVTKIKAKEKRTIKLTTTLPKYVNVQNAKFLISLVEAESKLELPLASYLLPYKVLNVAVTPENTGRVIAVDGINVLTQIKSVRRNENNDVNNYILTYTLENKGQKAVTIPNYNLKVVTSTGLEIPAATDGLKSLVLAPLQKKEIEITATLSKAINTNAMKLAVEQPKEKETDKTYPVANYKIPNVSQTGTTTKEFYYTKDNSKYEISLSSVDRLPWEDNDIVNFNVKVKNLSGTTAPALALKGYVSINGAKQDVGQIRIIKQDSNVSINANSESYVTYSVKVPYTTSINDVSLTLQEEVDNVTNTLVEFNKQYTSSGIADLGSIDLFKITSIGRRSEFSVANVQTYAGTTESIVYAEIVMKNSELRYADLAKLSAYFKTSAGVYLPATLSKVTSKIVPEGKALIGIWAEVRTKYSMYDMQLIVGEATTNSNFTTQDGSADGYINATKLNLPKENVMVGSITDVLSFSPFEFKLSNLYTVLEDATKVRINFNYSLLEKNTYDLVAQNHKITIEIEDKDTKVQQSFELSKSDVSGGLTVGSGITKSISYENPNFKDLMYRGFRLNIYDEYLGHKKLLASQYVNSFDAVNQ